MPGNLTPAAPTDVMPSNLSRAFHEELHLECDMNMYPDGSSDRNALAENDRHYFTMQQALVPDDYTALHNFYFAHQGRPFYFYNVRETVPPFSFDPTGSDPIGRYTVVFDGTWTETYGFDRNLLGTGIVTGGYARAATENLGLREVV